MTIVLHGLQLAELRAERARWAALEESKAALEREVAQWKSRYQQAAARSDELAADVASLQSELLAARLEASSNILPTSIQCLKTGCMHRPDRSFLHVHTILPQLFWSISHLSGTDSLAL